MCNYLDVSTMVVHGIKDFKSKVLIQNMRKVITLFYTIILVETLKKLFLKNNYLC